MLFIKVQKKDAQKTKEYLIRNDLFDKYGRNFTEKEHIFFPVIKKFEYMGSEFVEKEVEPIQEKKDFKEIIKEKLTQKEIEYLKTAYDQIGNIAILEIDDEIKDKQDIIAQALLDSNPNIRTVLKKSGIHEGVFRTQKMDFIAGIDTRETITKENGIRLKVNVEEVYYSPRLSTDRKRITEQIEAGEEILCMFSGAGPYPITFAKNTLAKRIVGIEINPVGHRLALENLKLNKVNNVEIFNGDVNDIVPTLNQKFDRVLMPLPKSAEDFLETALLASKKGTIVHFYDFLNEDDFEQAYEKVKEACKNMSLEPEFIELVKCGQHAPHVFRICLDFRIKETLK